MVVGTPETVAEHPTSHTGRYLKQVLQQHPTQEVKAGQKPQAPSLTYGSLQQLIKHRTDSWGVLWAVGSMKRQNRDAGC